MEHPLLREANAPKLPLRLNLVQLNRRSKENRPGQPLLLLLTFFTVVIVSTGFVANIVYKISVTERVRASDCRLTRLRSSLNRWRWVLELGRDVFEVLNLSFLLLLGHRLVLLLRCSRRSGCHRCRSNIFLRLGILLDEFPELSENLVRKLIDVELKLVVLNALFGSKD